MSVPANGNTSRTYAARRIGARFSRASAAPVTGERSTEVRWRRGAKQARTRNRSLAERTKMAVTEPPKDTPFGLDANVAAGLAYLFCLLGGIVMLVGGGTNRFVKWAAAQSIVLWVVYFILGFVLSFIHLWILYPIIWILALIAWVWTFVTAFQGKEVRVPGIANITESIFKSQLT